MAARAVLVLSANLKYYPLSSLENPSKKQCMQSDTIGHYTYLAQPQPCDCRPTVGILHVCTNTYMCVY